MFRVSDRLDVRVAKPVQLNWIYLTAWAQDSVVHFRDDIYLQDGIGNAPMTHPAAVAANQAGQGGQAAPAGYGAAQGFQGTGAGPTYTNSVQPASNSYSGGPIPLVDVPRR
jgi:hypothetical protein